MADALDSKSSTRKGVSVQVRSPVLLSCLSENAYVEFEKNSNFSKSRDLNPNCSQSVPGGFPKGQNPIRFFG